MTVPDARKAKVLDRPACTPSAIRAVLAANADAAVLRRYDSDLDTAYEQGRQEGDLTPLVQAVRRWWFEADAYGLDEAQRRELVPLLTRRIRAMHDFLARQASAGVQPWTGLWETGHGDAWQADADYTEAREAVLAAALVS